MNKIIESELNKTLLADLSHFDEETQTFHIPKYSQFKYEIEHCYIVELEPSLLSKDDIVAINWNKGIVPLYSCYQIEVMKILQKMIYVQGFVYDKEAKQIKSSLYWEGWFPIDRIKCLKEVQ